MLTVVTPPPTNDLTTLDRLKLEIGVPWEDHSRDEILYAWIAEASGAIAAYCNRPEGFGRARVLQTERLGWAWRARDGILLERDIDPAIVSVEVDGLALDAEAPDWELAGGVLRRFSPGGRYLVGWAGTVAVTYDAGYGLVATLPFDLERACLDLCRGMDASKGRDPALRSIRIMDLVQKDYFPATAAGTSAGMPPETAARLDKYRRPLAS